MQKIAKMNAVKTAWRSLTKRMVLRPGVAGTPLAWGIALQTVPSRLKLK